MNNYSHIQYRASDPNVSVYINASAGSGKTKVLVDRILRLLLVGNKLSNILCVTFTNAAAEEIIKRLKTKTKKWCVAADDILMQELSELLQEEISAELLTMARSLYGMLLAEFNNIKIQTMHAFCARILNISVDSNHCVENKVISNAKKHELIKYVYYESMRSENLKSIVETLALLFNNHTLFEYVTNLILQYANFYTYLKTVRDEEHLKRRIFNVFSLVENFDWEIFFIEQLKKIDTEELLLISRSINTQESQVMLSWLLSDVKVKSENFFQYANIFLTQEYKKRSRITGFKDVNAKHKEQLLQHQQWVFKIMQVNKSYNAARNNFAFVRFTQEVFLGYERMKAQLGLLDYDQLLINTVELLQNSEDRHGLLWQLDCEIDHILVDEAQDLNSYQWQIIKLLSEEFFVGIGTKDIDRTIFIVGDQKQSIFGFQGAKPDTFVNIAKYYQQKAQNALKKWIEVDLNVSFRSGKEILELIDKTFISNNLTSKFAFCYQNHISYRGTTACFELWQLEQIEQRQRSDQWFIPIKGENNQLNKGVGQLIASKILEWLEKQRLICGSNKIFELADLMIIFRKRGRIYQEVCNALIQQNIDFIPCGAIYLMDQLIVLDILAILKFVLNQDDDLNLASLLKSDFFSLDEDIIFEIAFNRGSYTLWQVLDADIKYQYIKEKLLNYIELFQKNSLYSFFYQIILQNYSGNISSILETFLNAVINFENLYKSTTEFIEWLETEKVQVLYNSNKNVVKITTIHSAKGLESSIVILADAFESENLPYNSIFWHNGELVFSFGTQYDDDLLQMVKEKYRDVQQNENLRLLYVAMTRARDEIYIIGENKGKSGNWYELVRQSQIIKGSER